MKQYFQLLGIVVVMCVVTVAALNPEAGIAAINEVKDAALALVGQAPQAQ